MKREREEKEDDIDDEMVAKECCEFTHLMWAAFHSQDGDRYLRYGKVGVKEGERIVVVVHHILRDVLRRDCWKGEWM